MRYEDANWQKAMRLKVDYNNMLAGYSKAAAAITPQEIAALKDKAAEAFQFIAQNRGKGTMEWSELPYNQDAVVADILQEAKAIREKCDTFVVLGIGGSALGPIAVQQALNLSLIHIFCGRGRGIGSHWGRLQRPNGGCGHCHCSTRLSAPAVATATIWALKASPMATDTPPAPANMP